MKIRKKRRVQTMSEIKWSPAQESAITSVDSNVLLSAGAGSGKTAVLTERIYQLVKNGADLSRFLVLTFTNAASAEMKKRIRERLLGDEKLSGYTSIIENSHIETFDSFALFLVKRYAFRLGVSPNIGILDGTLLDIQRNNICNNLITYLYINKDSDFLDLISRYCSKNDNQIRDYILELSKTAGNQLNKDEYLSNFIKHYFDEERLNKIIDEKLKSMANAIETAIKEAEGLENPEDATNIINYLEDLLTCANDYDSLVAKIDLNSFPGKTKTPTSDKDYRDYIKSKLGKVLVGEQEFGSRQEIIDQYMSSKKDVETMLKIVQQIEKELDAFKKEKSLYPFADVAALALKALDMPDIREDMSNYFQYILVDEYQDTSLLQELVINKLERNNVCMVGDIKQSIYRFRNADCTLFQEKFDLYKDGKGGKLINLNTSYRSRKEIVDIVNEMFEKLMTPKSNPIDYSQGHNFEYGFKKYEELMDPNEDYKLKVYRYPIEKGKSSLEVETNIIALDIYNKIQKKYQVYDSSTKSFRNCTLKDFAIIVDKGSNFDKIKAILSNHNLAVKVVYDEPVRDSELVLVLKNLLVLFSKVSNEEYDDKFKHAFVSISRSFVIEDKDQTIFDYVKNGNYYDSPLLKKIYSVVNRCKYMSLETILCELVDGFKIYDQLNKLTKFSNNVNKIELFVNLAKEMDSLGMPLEGLISYFEDLNNFDLEISYVDKDVSENSITLITIHRSKGLEYPIVYLPGLTSSFTHSAQTAFLINDKYGPLLPGVGNNAKSSLFNHLLKLDEAKADFEERLRLFYVAVTRARERLIMVYGMKENGEPNIIEATSCNSFAKLIHYLGLEMKYGIDAPSIDKNIVRIEGQLPEKHITVSSIDVKPVEKIKKRASKEQTSEVNEELLEFGSEIHYLLEIADYETKDLSFVKDSKMQRYVRNVLYSEIFKNVKNNQILHEFSFFDEKNNVNGIIDCMVNKDDEIDIIDFKLKNLDDNKYVLQLHTYRDYIEQITEKKIKLYLISAITGEVKEIE